MKQLAIILLLIISHSLFAQDKKELEQKRTQKYNELKQKSKLLEKAESEKKVSVNKLLVLQTQIEKRKNNIAQLNQDISELENNINVLSDQVFGLNQNIEMLKSDYAKVVYNQYYYFKGYSKMMFVFASRDFNQAYRRITYLKQFSNYRKNQINKINNRAIELSKKKIEYDRVKSSKEQLVTEKIIETDKLNNDLSLENKFYKSLQSREKELRADIDDLKATAKKIEKEIEEIIRKERLSAARSKKSNTKKVVVESVSLNNDFAKNKGNFPYPVTDGIIISHFGEHPHPVIKGIKVNNNGVDISVKGQSDVKSIFAGEVSKIFSIKGSNYVIIIRHGDYLTVYQNITQVSVKTGENVKTNQSIGIVQNDSDENPILHFELWHELTKLNPEEWLKKM